MSRLIIGFKPQIGGGGVITFAGDRPNQAVYWFLTGYDPSTQQEVPPVGYLKWDKTYTDNSCCSTNLYFAPLTDTGGVYDIVWVEWAD